MEENAEAIIFLIDNSDTSINGDFEPSRLEAQKLAAQRLGNFNLKQSPNSQVALGSIGSECFGMKCSLSKSTKQFSTAFSKIEAGGKAQIVRGITCAFLTLKRRDPDIKGKRVVLFICSKHDLTMDSARELAQRANKEQISVDVIAFGQEVDKLDILEAFTSMTVNESYFIRIKKNDFILSDSVLASPLGPGIQQQIEQSDDISDDEELLAAIKASMEDSDNDYEDIQSSEEDIE